MGISVTFIGGSAMTNKENVYKLMIDGEWHTTTEITKIGSFGGMRRLQELKALINQKKYPNIINFEKRRCADKKQFEYRFILAAKSPEKETKPIVVIEKKKEKKVDKESIREERIVDRKNNFIAMAEVLEAYGHGD